MLTNDELQRLKRYVDLATYMDEELRDKLLETIRKLKVAEAQGSIVPQSAIQAMIDCVPDKLMADIVNDFRNGASSPSGLLKAGAAPVRGTGWQSPPRERDRTNEFRMFDEMVAALAGGPNDTSRLR